MKTDIFSPLNCALCKYNICYNELPFCAECIGELQKLLISPCRKCGKLPSLCECGGNSGLRFAFFYKGRTAQKLIYAHKTKADSRVADFLAELVVRSSGINPKSYDAVAFVPRLRRNKRRYGYDQSELLAKSLSRLYGIELIYPLERVGGSEQKLLGRAERYKNMKNRFKIREDFDTEVKYNKILLVDDVCTTGATITACADILRGNIARGVVPFVIAKTD